MAALAFRNAKSIDVGRFPQLEDGPRAELSSFQFHAELGTVLHQYMRCPVEAYVQSHAKMDLTTIRTMMIIIIIAVHRAPGYLSV